MKHCPVNNAHMLVNIPTKINITTAFLTLVLLFKCCLSLRHKKRHRLFQICAIIHKIIHYLLFVFPHPISITIQTVIYRSIFLFLNLSPSSLKTMCGEKSLNLRISTNSLFVTTLLSPHGLYDRIDPLPRLFQA